MGHRSSKSSAGSTDGNTTTINKNQSVKTSKQSKRRSTQSKSLKITDRVPVRSENNFVPIVQFEDGTVAESTQLNDIINNSNNDQLVANNQSGQIIIKIQFRRRLSRMENRQSRRSQQLQQTQTAGNAITDSTYRHITDSNSNQLPSVLNVTLNQNFMHDGSVNCAQRTSAEATRSGAAGTCRNSLLNNNIEAVSECINELHIREPSMDESGAIDAAEYCEVLEGPSTSISNKHTSKKMNIKAIGDDYSRRAKSKSTFMNLKNILEASTSKSSRNKESQQSHTQLHSQSQSTVNNNRDHSQDIRTHQVSLLAVPVPLTHGETATSITSSNTAVLTSPTPISITTSATASTATLPTNSANGMVPNQVSIWGTEGRTDVIIPLNSQLVVVCPHKSVLTLGRVDDDGIRLTTEIVGSGADRENSNLTTVQSQSQSFLVKSTPNGPIVHSQVDFVHCLVPDLERITNSSFYWGKMDRYEAERLLEGKTEGTFLLRDSAQEEYLFSVTFRKYGRSLHARIEQSGHKFSFDCHDPCVFTAPTVTGLLEHYKDPACVMFFEPMLTIPFHRKAAFSLQELARATIVSHTTYDGINKLELPVRLKAYLKEYHYKQKLRVKPVDDAFFTCT